MSTTTTRKKINDNLYMNAKVHGVDTCIEYVNNNEQRHCDFGPALLSNDNFNHHQYCEWWENGKIIAVFESKTGIMKKTDKDTYPNFYEVQVPEKWKGQESSLNLYDIGLCNRPMPIYDNELPPTLALAASLPQNNELYKEHNNNNDIEFQPNLGKTQIQSNEPILIKPIDAKNNDLQKTEVTKESTETNTKISFKDRLDAIKKQRVGYEEMLLNSKIDQLASFDIHKRLSENEEFAKKNLFINKLFGSVASTAIVGSVGAIVVGVATVASLPALGVAAAIGGFMMGATGSAVLLAGGDELFKSASMIFKSTKAHNLDLVEDELKQLRNNVDSFRVNRKLTATDYFNASVTSIVDKYAEITEKTKNLFKPLSHDDVSNRIKNMKKLKDLDNTAISKLKPN